MKTQSRRGVTVPPDFHFGAERMVSQYMPPVPEGLLGARKTAVAEWKTERREIPAVNQPMDWMGGRGVSLVFSW